MIRCYKDCKYNKYDYCSKYDEKIIVSRNQAHPGLLIHPLQYLTIFYNEENEDVDELIDLADKYLNGDEVVDSICNYFARYGQISFKQRKLLLYKLFNCYEEKEPKQYINFCQVE